MSESQDGKPAGPHSGDRAMITVYLAALALGFVCAVAVYFDLI